MKPSKNWRTRLYDHANLKSLFYQGLDSDLRLMFRWSTSLIIGRVHGYKTNILAELKSRWINAQKANSENLYFVYGCPVLMEKSKKLILTLVSHFQISNITKGKYDRKSTEKSKRSNSLFVFPLKKVREKYHAYTQGQENENKKESRQHKLSVCWTNKYFCLKTHR